MEKPLSDQAPESLVTIIGAAYFQPIADLLKELLSRHELKSNPVKTGLWENGYSSAICILAVACLESFVMRVRFMRRNEPAAKEKFVPDCVKGLFPDFPRIDELVEIFVLRDLLIHNHLWTVGFSWNDDPGMELHTASKDEMSGDKKYRQNVDAATRLTIRLGLNTLPIRVNREDVFKALKVFWDTLLFFEAKDRSLCYVSDCNVMSGGKLINFGKLISKPTTLASS